jgi:hypothetical protein
MSQNPPENALEVASHALLDCSRCGEDACIVEWKGAAMVRVRRKTKCKHYHPRKGAMNSPTCSSGECDNAAQAVAKWNSSQSNRELSRPPSVDNTTRPLP